MAAARFRLADRAFARFKINSLTSGGFETPERQVGEQVPALKRLP